MILDKKTVDSYTDNAMSLDDYKKNRGLILNKKIVDNYTDMVFGDDHGNDDDNDIEYIVLKNAQYSALADGIKSIDPDIDLMLFSDKYDREITSLCNTNDIYIIGQALTTQYNYCKYNHISTLPDAKDQKRREEIKEWVQYTNPKRYRRYIEDKNEQFSENFTRFYENRSGRIENNKYQTEPYNIDSILQLHSGFVAKLSKPYIAAILGRVIFICIEHYVQHATTLLPFQKNQEIKK